MTRFYSLAYWHLVSPAPFVEKIENESVNGSVVSDSLLPPWTKTHQAPLSMGFSRQEYWRGLPCPSPEDLPNPGIEPASLMSPELAGRLFITSATWEAFEKITLSQLKHLRTLVKNQCTTNINYFCTPNSILFNYSFMPAIYYFKII